MVPSKATYQTHMVENFFKKYTIQRPSPDLPNQFLRIKTRIYDSKVPVYEIAYGNHLIGKIL